MITTKSNGGRRGANRCGCGPRVQRLETEAPAGTRNHTWKNKLPHGRGERGNQRSILVLFLGLSEAGLKHSSGKPWQTVLKTNTPPLKILLFSLLDKCMR